MTTWTTAVWYNFNANSMEKYAHMSHGAYLTGSDDASAAEQYLKHHHPEYTVDYDLTDEDSTVYVNENLSDVVIAYRGTSKLRDIPMDIAIAGGTIPSRFVQAEQKYFEVQSRYPRSHIVATGHSAGAAQSLYVAKRHSIEGHHFNVGSFVHHTRADLRRQFECLFENCTADRMQTIYTAVWKHFIPDYVGGWSLANVAKHVYVPPKKLDIHSLDNFWKQGLTPPTHRLTPQASLISSFSEPVNTYYSYLEQKRRKKNVGRH